MVKILWVGRMDLFPKCPGVSDKSFTRDWQNAARATASSTPRDGVADTDLELAAELRGAGRMSHQMCV